MEQNNNSSSTVLYTRHYNSPCGELILCSFKGKLCLCDWLNGKHRERTEEQLSKVLKAEYRNETSDVIDRTIAALDEYFSGKRTAFDNIDYLFVGTDFQKRVWNELLHIPFGQTLSYSEIAHRLGCPKAVRAVANAIGANPISILIPCHRVIGSNGSLTGYAGGLSTKEFLLKLENYDG